MEIVIAVVYNNSHQNSTTVNNVGAVWRSIDHINSSNNLIYANLDEPNNVPMGADFVNAAKISTLPTVLFLEQLPTQQRIITRMTGSHLSAQLIQQVYLKVLNGAYQGTGTGTKEESDGVFPTGEGSGGLGFGLLDLGLPNIFWKGLAIYAGYKTATSDKDAGKLIYGSLTAVSALKAVE